MSFFEFESDGQAQTVRFFPGLGDTAFKAETSFHQWWEQVVYVLPSSARLRRKDIILTAANKDGGAHIDASLTPEYEQLAAPGAAGEWISVVDGVEQRTPIIGTHFVCLRQMGYEVLHSPELLSLLNT